MEENLEQLYDDQFIETCAPWVAPYIGDLNIVPYTAWCLMWPRRVHVANTIRYRRRKGTASTARATGTRCHRLAGAGGGAFSAAGLDANMNHLRAQAHYSPDLRNWEKLHWRDTAFDTIAHRWTCGASAPAPRATIFPTLAFLSWRVRAFPLTRSPAVVDPDIGGGLRFRFNPLGVDMALYNTPETEEEISHLAEPLNVPMPFRAPLAQGASDDYYGPERACGWNWTTIRRN